MNNTSSKSLRRRELLAASAALGALSLAGCATGMATGPSIGRGVAEQPREVGEQFLGVQVVV